MTCLDLVGPYAEAVVNNFLEMSCVKVAQAYGIDTLIFHEILNGVEVLGVFILLRREKFDNRLGIHMHLQTANETEVSPAFLAEVFGTVQ